MAATTTDTFSAQQQGTIIGSASTVYSTARNAASGTAFNYTTSTSANSAIYVQYFTEKGIGYYRLNRSFLRFDVSAVNGTVTAATLKVPGVTYGSSDVIVVKSDAFTGIGDTLVGADFNNLDFTQAYSSEITTWNVGSFNNISLNGNAATDLENQSIFTVALIDHDYDFLNVSTTTNPRAGILFADGTDEIGLEVTWVVGGGGPSFNINGISAANIGSINGVEAASIASGNGV